MASLLLNRKALLSYCQNNAVIEITRMNTDDSIHHVNVYHGYSEHSQMRFESLLNQDCWHHDDTPMTHNEVDQWGDVLSKEVEFYWYQWQPKATCMQVVSDMSYADLVDQQLENNWKEQPHD